MKKCHKIKFLLVQLAAEDISQKDKDTILNHLNECSSCLLEYKKIQSLYHDLAQWDENSQKVIHGQTDLIKVRQKIYQQINQKESTPMPKRTFFHQPKILVPAMISIFIVGFLLGYFFFLIRPKEKDVLKVQSQTTIQLARMESVLAQKEVVTYLQKSQLVLTDLLNYCPDGSLPLVQAKFNAKQIKILVNKSRFFQNQLDDIQLLSARDLLVKLELLFLEISSYKAPLSCPELQKWQQFILKEKLLLKIRLIENEILNSRVSEV